jgi:hypothetical protein
MKIEFKAGIVVLILAGLWAMSEHWYVEKAYERYIEGKPVPSSDNGPKRGNAGAIEGKPVPSSDNGPKRGNAGAVAGKVACQYCGLKISDTPRMRELHAKVCPRN